MSSMNQAWRERHRQRRLAQARERLVAKLRGRGIESEAVLEAIGRVPRHLFVEDAMLHRAYEDVALPIGMKQTISQPFTVAYQTELLEVEQGGRVLEIGTGSGYQAAVLCEMGVRVYTIERHARLQERALEVLREAGYRVTARVGDGAEGWATHAPYDAVVVTAGAETVPQPLVEQLRMPEEDRRGGRLVIPVGGRKSQTMLRIERTGEAQWAREELSAFRFVPLVRGK